MDGLLLKIKPGEFATFSMKGIYAHVWFDCRTSFSDAGSRVEESGEWEVIVMDTNDPTSPKPKREFARKAFRFAEHKRSLDVARAAATWIKRTLQREVKEGAN